MADSKLTIDRVSKVFPGARGGAPVAALRDVSVEIGAGELVSIVGPSGCGKSTLLGIVAGLLKPTGGSVLVDGERPKELLGSVGYMPQRDSLMPWRTVLGNTALGLELSGVKRKEARERARAEFERFGLAGFEDRWPGELSGGMRQRAALLRTFLAGRDLMLLDEPFSSLDALTREEMRRWLLDLWSRDRPTIVLVTHDVEEAIFLSDRVHVMSGRPGAVALTVDVDLDRPRDPAIALSPEFQELRREVLGPLREAAGQGPPESSPWESR